MRVELQQAARDAGGFAPHAPVESGGHGLGMSDRAPVFEEAGYSLFGPLALNIAAPDEGNVHMLDRIADPEQKQRFLEPLARGEVRSAFAMAEPAPGAGSDPSVLGAVDRGFEYAQVRLGPARMTHVMRWLGAARRGHDVAVAHVAEREGFGSRLGDLPTRTDQQSPRSGGLGGLPMRRSGETARL